MRNADARGQKKASKQQSVFVPNSLGADPMCEQARKGCSSKINVLLLISISVSTSTGGNGVGSLSSTGFPEQKEAEERGQRLKLPHFSKK